MTARTPNKRGPHEHITSTDWRLLVCTAIFLCSIVLKISDNPKISQIRSITIDILEGGLPTNQALVVMGRMLDKEDLVSVFLPSNQIGVQEQEANNKVSTDIYTESNYEEEALEDRTTSHFPDQIDKTVYVLKYRTVSPVIGTKSSDFGERIHPITGKQSFHYGLDIAAPKGTDIVAFADGTVRETGSNSYGNYVIIDYDDGFSTLYAHCSKVLSKAGDSVLCGEKVAEVGATGKATGNHLHLELWHANKALDPGLYVSYT